MDKLEEEYYSELFQKEIAYNRPRIFNKLIIEGRKRFYPINVGEKVYLSGCVPYMFLYEEKSIKIDNWDILLEYMIELFFDGEANKKEMWLYYKSTKEEIIKNKFVNGYEIEQRYYEAILFLLKKGEINKEKCKLYIYCPPSAEPFEVKQYIEKKFKEELEDYIIKKYNKEKEVAQNIVNKIDKYLNPILLSITTKYYNFFLFDDLDKFTYYASQVRRYIQREIKNEKTRKQLNLYIDIMFNCYKLNPKMDLY